MDQTGPLLAEDSLDLRVAAGPWIFLDLSTRCLTFKFIILTIWQCDSVWRRYSPRTDALRLPMFLHVDSTQKHVRRVVTEALGVKVVNMPKMGKDVCCLKPIGTDYPRERHDRIDTQMFHACAVVTSSMAADRQLLPCSPMAVAPSGTLWYRVDGLGKNETLDNKTENGKSVNVGSCGVAAEYSTRDRNPEVQLTRPAENRTVKSNVLCKIDGPTATVCEQPGLLRPNPTDQSRTPDRSASDGESMSVWSRWFGGKLTIVRPGSRVGGGVGQDVLTDSAAPIDGCGDTGEGTGAERAGVNNLPPRD
ncbi:hypothetical protein Bbelb_355330 [Branchiostoma belcheri]|nr:hypothetical protein Bbelb_355330 [Branchiostoma belcheri]